MDAIGGLFERPHGVHSAILASLRLAGRGAGYEFEELRNLARSAGLSTADCVKVTLRSPNPGFGIGSGKVEELRVRLEESGADALIIDGDLTATQQRNLEQRLHVRVLTRPELIIYIFSLRARTREGRLQVELAALRHAQSRLVGGWSHLDRQRGGVNLRGVGESQLDIDRRLVGGRIAITRQRLDRVHRQRATQRRLRTRSELAHVALVGYTNAGKSTLFNRLCQASAYTDDKLFATLDATMRTTVIEGIGKVVISDTVGFINRLPVNLIDAFKSTLEEVANADLLLHVIDASAPTAPARASVLEVLGELGADGIPTLEVINKIDRLDACPSQNSENRAAISALSGQGIDGLRRLISVRLGATMEPLTIRVEPSAGKTRAWLYDLDAVVGETVNSDGSMNMRIRIGRQHLSRLADVEGVSF